MSADDAGSQTAVVPRGLSTPGPLRADGWLGLDEAARRSGRSKGHLSRQCRDEWQARSLARLHKAGRGKPVWQVHETADAGLARVKFAEAIGTDLRHLTDKARETALFRRRVLTRWEEAVAAALKLGFDRDAGTGRFLQQLLIDEGHEVSRSTLYNWERRWRSGGLAALADGRIARTAEAAAAPKDPFFEFVARLYLTPRKLKLTVCHEMAGLKAEEQGWTVRSYKACERHLKTLPKGVILRKRFGDEAYTNEAEPYLERDYSCLRSNEIWDSDHHQFDVVVNAGGKLVRPWLTCWQDMRSRLIVGWEVRAEDPNSDVILSTFRRAVLAHGVPEGVLHDNGKDYHSFALHGRTKRDRWERRKVKAALDVERSEGIFGALDCKVTFCWPYHGQSKPIERFFGTVETRTGVWPTYCGRATTEKPEDLQLQLERGKAPTLADFVDWFGAWLEAGYQQAPHQGDGLDGRTPAAVWAECLSAKRTASVELLDVLLLKPTPPVKVAQNGVAWQGLRYGQYEPALQALLAQDVVLRVDDRDLSRVQVWTVAGKFVCLAPANARVPANATSAELREAIQQKRQARKALKDFHAMGPRAAEDLPDLIVRAAARRAAEAAADGPNPDAPPPSLKPVRHPIEDQLPALRAALEGQQLRPAVGAESLSMDDLRAAMRACDAAARPADEDAAGGIVPGTLEQLGRLLNREIADDT